MILETLGNRPNYRSRDGEAPSDQEIISRECEGPSEPAFYIIIIDNKGS